MRLMRTCWMDVALTLEQARTLQVTQPDVLIAGPTSGITDLESTVAFGRGDRKRACMLSCG